MLSLHQKAIFLDRDGTLNVDSGYVHCIDEWKWLPGAIEALKNFKDAGYLLIVVTNQAGIARGYYTERDVFLLHEKINESISSLGVKIDSFYFCPHHPDFTGPCACRKPAPGLIYQAAMDHQIDLSKSWLIGDKPSDIEAGISAGLRTILLTASENSMPPLQTTSTEIFESLWDASHFILSCHSELNQCGKSP